MIIFKKAKNYTAIHLQGLKGGSSISGDLQEKKTSTNHRRRVIGDVPGCDWWRQLHQSQTSTSREVMHFSLVGNVVYSILIVIKHVFTKTSVNANLLGVSTGAYWTSLQPEFLWWVYIAFLRFYWLFRDRKWGKWMRESFPGTKLLCSIPRASPEPGPSQTKDLRLRVQAIRVSKPDRGSKRDHNKH